MVFCFKGIIYYSIYYRLIQQNICKCLPGVAIATKSRKVPKLNDNLLVLQFRKFAVDIFIHEVKFWVKIMTNLLAFPWNMHLNCSKKPSECQHSTYNIKYNRNYYVVNY